MAFEAISGDSCRPLHCDLRNAALSTSHFLPSGLYRRLRHFTGSTRTKRARGLGQMSVPLPCT